MFAVHFVCLQSHLYLMHSTLLKTGNVYATLNECKMITPSFSTGRARQRHRTVASEGIAAQQGTSIFFPAGYQVAFLLSRLFFLHAETSLCSAGKYSNANIPGLKNAREASVNARLECCRADAGILQTPA